ncbi:RraA family protein [Mycobacterium sp. NPDC003449]
MPTSEILDSLSTLGASTVYEGSGLDCWVDPAIRPAWSGARVAGPAFPAAGPVGDNLALQHAVREAPAGSVIVYDGGGAQFGYFGEILASIAKVRGVAGLVIDGTVRDVDEIAAMGFPVFSRGIAMRTTAKRDPGARGEPVELGNRTVRSGDMVVADNDGVVVVPAENLTEALAGANQRSSHERDRLATIRSGEIPPVKTK